MKMIQILLGEWERVREETTGRVFLVGKFLQMPVSVALESADVEQVDFDFIQDKVSKFAYIKRQTELFFERIAKSRPDWLGMAAGRGWRIIRIALLALNSRLAAGRRVGALFIGKVCFRLRSRMGFW